MKINILDLIPMFIFFEQLCIRFDCGQGDVLRDREYEILREYKKYL